MFSDALPATIGTAERPFAVILLPATAFGTARTELQPSTDTSVKGPGKGCCSPPAGLQSAWQPSRAPAPRSDAWRPL